jgi:UDP-glucose 4-epimerase
MNSKNINFFITGAAGFIGSHLTNYLLKKNYEVIALDSQKFGTWENIKRDKNLTIVSKDLRNIKNFKKYFDKQTVVIHLAAEKHNNSLQYPDKIFETNCIATNRLFEQACEKKVKKIIFSSSLYVYGILEGSAMKESDNCLPNTIYGNTKLSGELMLKQYAKKNGIRYAILRFFFVYGSKQFTGQGYPSVIIKNFNRIKNKQSPIIINDGKQSFDYIHIDDIIRAIEKVVGVKKNLTLNLSNNKPVTILQLTKIMLKVSQTNYKLIYAGHDWTKNTRRFGSNRLARKELFWTPKIKLEQGLKEVWKWLN